MVWSFKREKEDPKKLLNEALQCLTEIRVMLEIGGINAAKGLAEDIKQKLSKAGVISSSELMASCR